MITGIETQRAGLPDAVEYIISMDSEVTEREAMLVIAAYAKGYRDAIVSISEPQPSARPLARRR
jgi:hypothetical protein